MARPRKMRCECGTPVFYANERGIELVCECGERTLIPYEAMSGFERFAEFVESRRGAERRRPRSARSRTTRGREGKSKRHSGASPTG
jgi:hypothetical protein